MASNNGSQNTQRCGYSRTDSDTDSATNINATHTILHGVPDPFHQTVSGGYPGQSSQTASTGTGVVTAVPGRSISFGAPLRHPITLATAIAHCSSNHHTLSRLEAENAQLRTQYHQIINKLMQEHPESGSPPAPDWCTVIVCREEGRILESQFEDLSRRGSSGLDVTAGILGRLKYDYGSLLAAYRNVLREKALLKDDVKRLTRQSANFAGSQTHPFLHCVEDTDETPIIGLDDRCSNEVRNPDGSDGSTPAEQRLPKRRKRE
ncbi:hypothetical protein BJ322DRAFT_1042310 [Thelephora terrestris]|uniref:Uncharacterized protein n=1 Tax=Thelephora terrestris TaxID=56493 RepID=A0A9P6HL85_9AGAM|nr:hypothetical protein BJ322DRAFT_1042310 [Thelephora terrestris]